MRNIEVLLQDPAIGKWVKWVLILVVSKRKNPVLWANFLSLNGIIKRGLAEANSRVGFSNGDKIGNGVSSAMLFKATINNPGFPKDYLTLYIWMTLLKMGILKDDNLTVKAGGYIDKKVSKNVYLQWIYDNKQLIIYSLLSGQILSNYLTPTKKLNHKYLNNSLKSYILNPIWINFSLGANDHAINWCGLGKQYLKIQAILAIVNGVTSLTTKLLNNPPQEGEDGDDFWPRLKNYLLYVFHKSNAYVNLIFVPNICAILLLATTSPILSLFQPPYKKTVVKTYTKTIGFLVSFVTLYGNSKHWIKDFGYNRQNQEPSPRLISQSFLEGINVHLTRLIILSKWRILRDNYSGFKSIDSSTWNLYETLAMCFGTWNLMNIYDEVKDQHDKVSQSIKQDRLIKGVKQIMD